MRVNESLYEYYSPAELCWLLSGSAWEDNTRVPLQPDNNNYDIENIARPGSICIFYFDLGLLQFSAPSQNIMNMFQKWQKSSLR